MGFDADSSHGRTKLKANNWYICLAQYHGIINSEMKKAKRKIKDGLQFSF